MVVKIAEETYKKLEEARKGKRNNKIGIVANVVAVALLGPVYGWIPIALAAYYIVGYWNAREKEGDLERVLHQKMKISDAYLQKSGLENSVEN